MDDAYFNNGWKSFLNCSCHQMFSNYLSGEYFENNVYDSHSVFLYDSLLWGRQINDVPTIKKTIRSVFVFITHRVFI